MISGSSHYQCPAGRKQHLVTKVRQLLTKYLWHPLVHENGGYWYVLADKGEQWRQ